MEPKFLKRGIFQRIFGIPATGRPQDPGCWNFAEGTLRVDLERAPELAKPGGALRFEGGGLPLRVLVVRGEDGRLRAFENRCSHLGHRRLDPVPGTATVQCCSVNKSTYAHDGQKLFGPAPGPITVFPVHTDGGKMVADLSLAIKGRR